MAMIDEIRKRISAARLAGLTNPDDDPDATEDTTLSAAAVADAEGHFRTIAGVDANFLVREHVAAITTGFQYFCGLYTGKLNATTQQLWDRFNDMARSIRATVAIVPTTDSTRQRTTERVNRRMDFGPRQFDDYRADEAGVGDEDAS